DRVGNVQEQVREVIAHGLEPVQLKIHHQRKPGNRVPVIGMLADDGPADDVEIQPLLKHGVLGDVERIVKIHKAVAQHRPVSRQRGRQQEKNNASVHGTLALETGN
ncbi:MAG: hypothetical protein CO132_01915, partial [Candidatus Kerfeldbacteria bacterium CG_4_9_14_3_um_filter_45_8]